ncbi:MAG: flagellar hook-basal body complex protein FliE [Rhodobacteraceae bacterium]|nr:flagellar hook-basal body complex protein FliE [Paracoccaceae bacterium]TVR49640.1 MAG: flagellar hook-basal body complex protein FliE [Paracoccaceae bacterium]
MTISPAAAIQSYDQARRAAAPAPIPDATGPRAEGVFGAALGRFADGLAKDEATATQSLATGADPQALVEALAQTELAVESVVAVRDKVVEAYLEILRMPV